MKWLATLASVVLVLASVLDVYFTFAVAIPSFADVPAETRVLMPSMNSFWAYTLVKEGLTIFLAGVATYLSWTK